MTEELGILVVDDNDGCRELYSLWLSGDHEVVTAETGAEALDRIDREIDLVLLDRNMPGPGGHEVARQLRQEAYDCRIVMVSSERPDFDLESSPLDEYLQKPADREDIVGLVDTCRAQIEYQIALEDYYASSATLAEVEAQIHPDHLDGCGVYEELREQVDRKRTAVEDALARSELQWETVFSAIDTPSDLDAPDHAADHASPRTLT